MMFKWAAVVLLFLGILYQGQAYFAKRLEQIEKSGEETKIRNIFESNKSPTNTHNTLALHSTLQLNDQQLRLQNQHEQGNYQLDSAFQIEYIGILATSADQSIFDGQLIGIPLNQTTSLEIAAHQLERCAHECKDTVLQHAQKQNLSIKRDDKQLINDFANALAHDNQAVFMSCYRIGGKKALLSHNASSQQIATQPNQIWYVESIQTIDCKS